MAGRRADALLSRGNVNALEVDDDAGAASRPRSSFRPRVPSICRPSRCSPRSLDGVGSARPGAAGGGLDAMHLVSDLAHPRHNCSISAGLAEVHGALRGARACVRPGRLTRGCSSSHPGRAVEAAVIPKTGARPRVRGAPGCHLDAPAPHSFSSCPRSSTFSLFPSPARRRAARASTVEALCFLVVPFSRRWSRLADGHQLLLEPVGLSSRLSRYRAA